MIIQERGGHIKKYRDEHGKFFLPVTNVRIYKLSLLR